MNRIASLLLLIPLILAACARGETTLQPPEIHYGEDLCAECNMIISDPRFACGYLHETSPGRYVSVIFDDIGDMLRSARHHPEQAIVAWYVHDYPTESWLDATQATYVISAEFHTPMAHGIAAHASPSAAQQMADATHGEVTDWEGLMARYQTVE